MLRTELQELVEHSKEVEVNLPESSPKMVTEEGKPLSEPSEPIFEETTKVEEAVTNQAAAPVREEALGNEMSDPVPRRLSRSRDQTEATAGENAPAQTRLRRPRVR